MNMQDWAVALDWPHYLPHTGVLTDPLDEVIPGNMPLSRLWELEIFELADPKSFWPELQIPN